MLNRQIGTRPFILIAESVINLKYKHLESWTFNRRPDRLHLAVIVFAKVIASRIRYLCVMTFIVSSIAPGRAREGSCGSLVRHAKVIQFL